jgi:hypothetical protein
MPRQIYCPKRCLGRIRGLLKKVCAQVKSFNVCKEGQTFYVGTKFMASQCYIRLG